MKTIKAEWEEYFAACYPDGAPAAQCRECEQAFYSGALSLFELIRGLHDRSDDDAVIQLTSLHRQLVGRMVEIAAPTLSKHSGGGE